MPDQVQKVVAVAAEHICHAEGMEGVPEGATGAGSGNCHWGGELVGYRPASGYSVPQPGVGCDRSRTHHHASSVLALAVPLMYGSSDAWLRQAVTAANARALVALGTLAPSLTLKHSLLTICNDLSTRRTQHPEGSLPLAYTRRIGYLFLECSFWSEKPCRRITAPESFH